MKKLILVLCVLSLSLTSLEGQTRAEKKAIKLERVQKAYEKTKALVASGNFQFEGNWATTFRGNRISLIGNPNHLKIQNNRADANLPFFGEVRRGGAYGQSGGIIFDENMKDYEVSYNDTKRSISIAFEAKKVSENFVIILKVNAGGGTTLIVNTSNRSRMSYLGLLKAIEDPQIK